MTRRVAGLLLGALVLAVGAAPTRAQLPHLDPLPWFTTADSTSRLAVVAEFDRFDDSESGWSVNRAQLTAILPAGGRATWFLRVPVMGFDTNTLPVRERWPDAVGEEAAEGWPYEARLTGFGRMEVGAVGPLGLPLLRPLRYAVAAGLPTGTNSLYPFSSTSLPLRLQLRRSWYPGTRTGISLQAGYVAHMDATGDELTSDAFPDGFQLGAEAAWYRGRGHRWTCSWDYDDRSGRVSQLVGLGVWLPWTADGSVGLRVRRELAGSRHRPAAWYFTFALRFDSARYRPGATPDPPASTPQPAK